MFSGFLNCANGKKSQKVSHLMDKSFLFVPVNVNRPRNGYETVANIKVVFIDIFEQLVVANEVDYVTN